MVLSAQKIIFQKIEHDVNKDILKMDVMMINRTNGSPVVNVDAVLFQDLDEPIFVSSGNGNGRNKRFGDSVIVILISRYTCW